MQEAVCMSFFGFLRYGKAVAPTEILCSIMFQGCGGGLSQQPIICTSLILYKGTTFIIG